MLNTKLSCYSKSAKIVISIPQGICQPFNYKETVYSLIFQHPCFAQAAVVLAANVDRFPLTVFRRNEIERKPYPIFYEMAYLSAPFSALALLYYIYALKHARHAV